jgi:opacity protein-like surface antigen
VREGFSYYFRADVGYSWSGSASFAESGNLFGDGLGATTGGGLATAFTATPPFRFGSSQFAPVTTEAHDVFIGTFGVGAYFMPRFRGDLTIDFRGRQGFDANTTYSYTSSGGTFAGQTINGVLQETLRVRGVVTMANGYFDILPRGAFSPYIGAGIGFVYYDAERTQYMQETQVTGTSATGLGQQLIATTQGKQTSWGLAAALMAGVTVSFDHAWAIDIGYRAQYLDEVSVELTPTGQLSKATMGDHWEHQARIGLRLNIW